MKSATQKIKLFKKTSVHDVFDCNEACLTGCDCMTPLPIQILLKPLEVKSANLRP